MTRIPMVAATSVSVPASADTIARRSSTGTLAVATATQSGDATTLAQQTAAITAAQQLANNAQTATYTLAAGDAGELVTVTATAAATLTVPPNSAVTFPIGTVIEVAQGGAGQLTVAAGSGVTVNAPDGGLVLRAQYSRARLIKIATDTWLLHGDTSPARICSLIQATAQTFASNGNQWWLDVTFDSELTDPSNMHSTTTNTNRVVVPVKGLYRVSGGIAFVGDARGDRGVRYAVNGVAPVPGSMVRVSPSTVTNTSVAGRTMLVQLNAGDFVHLQAVQTTTANLNTVADSTTGEACTLLVELVTAN